MAQGSLPRAACQSNCAASSALPWVMSASLKASSKRARPFDLPAGLPDCPGPHFAVSLPETPGLNFVSRFILVDLLLRVHLCAHGWQRRKASPIRDVSCPGAHAYRGADEGGLLLLIFQRRRGQAYAHSAPPQAMSPSLFRLIPAFLKESFGHDLESFLTVGEIRGDRLVLEGLFELLDTLRIAQRLEGAQFQEPVAEGLAFAGKTGAQLEPRLETARIGAAGAPAILRGARQVARLVAFFADGGQRHGVERIEFQRLSKGLLARERSGLHLCEQRSPGFDDRVGCEEHGTNSLHFNAIAFGERLQYASIGVPDPELGGNSDVALESDSGFLRDRPGGAGRLGVGEGLPALPRRTGDHVPGSQPFRNY